MGKWFDDMNRFNFQTTTVLIKESKIQNDQKYERTNFRDSSEPTY